MRTPHCWLPALGLLVLPAVVPTALRAQADPTPARLEVRGDGISPRTFTSADLGALPRVERLAEEHGRSATFSGTPLADVLRSAGVPIDSVRGGRTGLYVLVVAADGYRALFSLAEVAPDLGGREVLVVNRRDGRALNGTEGPLRLVVPGDHRPTRWVRQVVSITVGRGNP